MMNRRVGVPTAVRPMEGRVGLTPSAAGELVQHGVEVGMQQGAGIASGYPDEACRARAAKVTGLLPTGSVIVDIAVDKGGCIETPRPAAYDAPTCVEEGVQHFCVTNLPAAVPRGAREALCAVMLPYLTALLAEDWRRDPRLPGMVNVDAGQRLHLALRA